MIQFRLYLSQYYYVTYNFATYPSLNQYVFVKIWEYNVVEYTAYMFRITKRNMAHFEVTVLD